MNKYFDLLRKKNVLEEDIKKHKGVLHNKFYELKKKEFAILDWALALIIVMNCLSAFMTNVVVVKETPSVQVMEFNPTVATAQGYEPHPAAPTFNTVIFTKALFWGSLIFIYLYNRKRIFSEEHLLVMQTLIFLLLVIFGWAYFNDLGFYLGKMLYGG